MKRVYKLEEPLRSFFEARYGKDELEKLERFFARESEKVIAQINSGNKLAEVGDFSWLVCPKGRGYMNDRLSFSEDDFEQSWEADDGWNYWPAPGMMALPKLNPNEMFLVLRDKSTVFELLDEEKIKELTKSVKPFIYQIVGGVDTTWDAWKKESEQRRNDEKAR